MVIRMNMVVHISFNILKSSTWIQLKNISVFIPSVIRYGTLCSFLTHFRICLFYFSDFDCCHINRFPGHNLEVFPIQKVTSFHVQRPILVYANYRSTSL